MSVRELNEKLSTINRVVVHPKYRSIGLGARLIRESLPLVGTPFVELVAVMARYNQFAERAGMRKIAEQPPPRQALAVAKVLEQLGFNLQLLGSEKYALEKLQALTDEERDKIRQAFIRQNHPRFMKHFAWRKVYGSKKDYAEAVKAANVERLAHLIKICGFLLQTKVYLFWTA